MTTNADILKATNETEKSTTLIPSPLSGVLARTPVFTRQWAMPNKHTFLIEPIGNLIRRYVGNGLGWIDAFAGENSPAEIKNDLNPEKPTQFHLDALEFLRSQPDESASGVIYDPPYSMTQAKECYDKYGSDKFEPTSMQYWGDCKNEIRRVLRLHGKVICCGWNSNGVGKGRLFRLDEILLVAHGGSKNDTMVTVETKIAHQQTLFPGVSG